jgi:uncharacterized membrane protein YfcA
MIFIFLIIGSLVGTLSGLLGIGGGIILVPTLNYVFEHQDHIAPGLCMHMAVATSLAVIMLTSSRTSWLYIQHNHFDRKLFMRFLPGLILGTLTGVQLGQHVHGQLYTQIFGLFLWGLAIKLLRPSKPSTGNSRLQKPIWFYFISFLTGNLSALFGIGGGIIMTPYFIHLEQRTLQAIGTATLCTLPIAIVSSISIKVIYGNELPINWTSVAIIGITSMLCAPIGAKLARQTSERRLKMIFAIVLSIVGAKMFFK